MATLASSSTEIPWLKYVVSSYKSAISQCVQRLPKTRSGKIMRRVLRKVVERDLDGLGDLSTLDNPAAVQEVIQGHRDLCGEEQQRWRSFGNWAVPQMASRKRSRFLSYQMYCRTFINFFILHVKFCGLRQKVNNLSLFQSLTKRNVMFYWVIQ